MSIRAILNNFPQKNKISRKFDFLSKIFPQLGKSQGPILHTENDQNMAIFIKISSF